MGVGFAQAERKVCFSVLIMGWCGHYADSGDWQKWPCHEEYEMENMRQQPPLVAACESVNKSENEADLSTTHSPLTSFKAR